MLPISVIIPTYNREKLISRAVKSVIDQTRSCAELIIVDDGSTDNTVSMLADLFTDVSLYNCILCQDNRGPAAARNAGIKQARFSFIAFLDSDDHWLKQKLEVQYYLLKESDSAMISHTKEKWLRRGEHLNQKKIHIPRNGYIFDHCLKLCAVGMSTVMLRREIFDKIGYFDESLRCCEDYDFWLRASSIYEFLLIDKPLTIKEGGRDDQVSFQYRQGMDRMRINSLKNILKGGELRQDQYLLALQEFERKSSIFGRGCIKHGKTDLGKKVLGDVVQEKRRACKRYPHLTKSINEKL